MTIEIAMLKFELCNYTKQKQLGLFHLVTSDTTNFYTIALFSWKGTVWGAQHSSVVSPQSVLTLNFAFYEHLVFPIYLSSMDITPEVNSM